MGTGMGFGMLFFWGALILIVVLLVRAMLGNAGTTSESPLETLRKRYANGEISDEEYEKMKNELQKM